MRTGDIAKLDDEGFCYIVDRAKDMLIRGGENIYCVEVENALAAHPAVIDAAVIGRPHRVLGEEPVAVVTIKPASTSPRTSCAPSCRPGGRIQGAGKDPSAPEMLPRNANGKILKRELSKMFVACAILPPDPAKTVRGSRPDGRRPRPLARGYSVPPTR